MSVTTPTIARTPVARLRWATTDSWVLARRDLTHRFNQPALTLIDLLFPVLILLMFGYLLGGAMAVPGGGDYREFLVPGILAVAMVFGVETTFTAISTDARRGVTDRFRSMPMAASAAVTGRAMADLAHALVVLAALVSAGLAVGWRWHAGLGAAVLALGLLLALRMATVWLGIYLGLALRRPEAVSAMQILVWPLALLSNAFVAPETMPGWLGAIAEWNPMSATVGAIRELFGNPGWGGESWAAKHAIGLAVAWPVVLIAVFAALSVRSYHRMNR